LFASWRYVESDFKVGVATTLSLLPLLSLSLLLLLLL
jgi:hypothetical protein